MLSQSDEPILPVARPCQSSGKCISESAPFFLWSADAKLRFYHFNNPWLAFTGRSLEEQAGDGWLESVHPDDVDQIIKALRSQLDAPKPLQMEMRVRRWDGLYRRLLCNALPQFTPEGVFAGYVGACIDISEREGANELKKALVEIVEESVNEILVFDVESLRCIESNRSARVNLRYSPEECRRLTPIDVFPAFTWREFLDLIEPLISNADSQIDFCTHCRRKDGSERHVQSHMHLIEISGKRALVVIGLDISDQVEHLEKLELNRRLGEFRGKTLERLTDDEPLESVLNEMALSLEAYSPHARCMVMSLNEEDGRLYLAAAPSMSRKVHDLFAEGLEVAEPKGCTATAAALGKTVIVEDIATHPLTRPYRFEALELGVRACCSTPVFGENAKVIGVLCLSIDEARAPNEAEMMWLQNAAQLAGLAMTRVKANEQLKQAREQAVAANRSKSEFLAMMSHEIRTPMTAVLGFADVLLGEEGLDRAPPERVEAFTTIKRNGEHLLNLINDILDLSKIEAGKLDVERLRCSPVDVLEDIWSLMRVRAEAKDLKLDIEYDGPVPEQINTDPLRLRQVLINLVGNAVKFTELGGVRVVARLTDADTQPKMRFDVIDTGIGIKPEQMSRLFKSFSQADTSTTRQFGGTGLGLVISQRLAHLLGGEITVESTTGKGATFSFTVSTGPLDGVPMVDGNRQQKPKPAPAKTERDSVKLDCRVLLAEDGPDNQRLITFVLRKAGAEVVVAENGRLACDTVLATERGQFLPDGTRPRPFDIVLMDMSMPEMDGYEATAKLRSEGFRKPIVALTAHAMPSDRQKCLEAGCDDYVTKPIDRPALLELVARYTTGAAAQQEAETLA